MPSRNEYADTLDKLAARLKRKPMTAKAIAEVFECCKPVAYQRLQALKERGETLYFIMVRESPTGPKSTAYGIR